MVYIEFQTNISTPHGGIRVKDELVKKIRGRKARMAVVGLGRVGLHTAVIFADIGYRVIGADVKKEVVELLSYVKSRAKEPGLAELVKKVVRRGKLKATTNVIRAVKTADIAIICVQTPVTSGKEPDLTYLKRACAAMAKGLQKGKLVVVESTVPPGTIKRVVAGMLEEGSGLKCGRDFWLAYCPERIASGRALQEFVENDRVIGGYNAESAEISVELFKMVTGGNIVVTDCATAEVMKLAENTFRDVNIAFANELALICEQLGVDIVDVIRLANTHPRVNIHRPGCGVGGPCLPKDPYLLLHPVKEIGLKSRVIEPSRRLNDQIPGHIVDIVIEGLKNTGKNVRKSKIAVLGTSYKGEVDDATHSPAEDIIHKLTGLGVRVVAYDPYCSESFGAEKTEDIFKAVKGADCILIATEHRMFEDLNLKKMRTLMKEKPIIVDCRRIVDPKNSVKQGFAYYGIGYNI